MYDDQPPFGADDKCRRVALRPASAGPQRAGHRRERHGPAGRGDARLFSPPLQPGQYRAGRRGPDRLRRARGLAPSGSAAIGRAVEDRPNVEPAAARDGFQVICKETASQQYVFSSPPGRPPKKRPLRRQVAGHRTGRRLGQPALLGIGRSRPGRARELRPRRAPGRGHHDDLHELRRPSKPPSICDSSSTSIAKSRPRESRRPNWIRPRARFARGSSSPPSVPAGGCFPWAAIGSIAASIVPSSRNWTWSPAHGRRLAAVLAKYPLTRAATVTIGPLAELQPQSAIVVLPASACVAIRRPAGGSCTEPWQAAMSGV